MLRYKQYQRHGQGCVNGGFYGRRKGRFAVPPLQNQNGRGRKRFCKHGGGFESSPFKTQRGGRGLRKKTRPDCGGRRSRTAVKREKGNGKRRGKYRAYFFGKEGGIGVHNAGQRAREAASRKPRPQPAD